MINLLMELANHLDAYRRNRRRPLACRFRKYTDSFQQYSHK